VCSHSHNRLKIARALLSSSRRLEAEASGSKSRDAHLRPRPADPDRTWPDAGCLSPAPTLDVFGWFSCGRRQNMALDRKTRFKDHKWKMQDKTAIDAGVRYWKLLIRFDTAGVYNLQETRARAGCGAHSHFGVFKRWHHAELNHPLSYSFLFLSLASGHPLVSAI
jgi:hypothetical protein